MGVGGCGRVLKTAEGRSDVRKLFMEHSIKFEKYILMLKYE